MNNAMNRFIFLAVTLGVLAPVPLTRAANETATAHATKGVQLAQQGAFDQAIEEFTKAIEVDPKDARIHRDRVGVYLTMQRFQDAVNDFTKAIELLPKDYAAECLQQGVSGLDGACANRCWSPTSYRWDPTCLCYRPLYFEEINLERYGYGCCDCLQPAVSAAHFFATVPVLPYCMAIDCPCQCEYALGTYRPGSCPPWRHNWPQCWPNGF